jgi:photosystem II stability/assembly factor-like uncharacterized protein
MVELYAATGDGLARIVQQGGEWRCKLVLEGTGVQCLAVDPWDQQLLFAGSRGRGIFRSRDGGENWESLHLPERDIFSLAISAADGVIYAGSEPSRIFVSHDRGENWRELEALRQIPSAPTWSFPPRPWTSHVRWIAPSPHDPHLLLVGIELGGLMLSEDGGASWSDHRPGAQRDVHALAWHPEVPSRAYEAGGGGAAWSHDGGRTWQPADTGRDRHYTWGLAIDPHDPDCWYVSANPGPRQAHSPEADAQALIYRWRGAGPWQALEDGLPQLLDSFVYALAAVPGWVFAGLGDGRLYASNDAGENWRQLAVSGDPIASVQALSARTDEHGD